MLNIYMNPIPLIVFTFGLDGEMVDTRDSKSRA